MNDFHQQFARKASFVDRVREAVGERDHSGDFFDTVRAAVEGPRQQDYGHPFDNHTRTATAEAQITLIDSLDLGRTIERDHYDKEMRRLRDALNERAWAVPL